MKQTATHRAKKDEPKTDKRLNKYSRKELFKEKNEKAVSDLKKAGVIKP